MTKPLILSRSPTKFFAVSLGLFPFLVLLDFASFKLRRQIKFHKLRSRNAIHFLSPVPGQRSRACTYNAVDSNHASFANSTLFALECVLRVANQRTFRNSASCFVCRLHVNTPFQFNLRNGHALQCCTCPITSCFFKTHSAAWLTFGFSNVIFNCGRSLFTLLLACLGAALVAIFLTIFLFSLVRKHRRRTSGHPFTSPSVGQLVTRSPPSCNALPTISALLSGNTSDSSSSGAPISPNTTDTSYTDPSTLNSPTRPLSPGPTIRLPQEPPPPYHQNTYCVYDNHFAQNAHLLSISWLFFMWSSLFEYGNLSNFGSFCVIFSTFL